MCVSMIGMVAGCALSLARLAAAAAPRNVRLFMGIAAGSRFEEGPFAILEALPVLTRETIQVPYHLPLAQRQLAADALGCRLARARRIQQSELPLLHPPHRHVRLRAHVDIRTTSANEDPSARISDMALSISFIPAFILPVCRSVEIESGWNPAWY